MSPLEAASAWGQVAELTDHYEQPGLIVVDEKAVAIDHIVEQPRPKCSADKAPGEIRADAGLVMDDLRYAAASFRSQGSSDLEHICGRGPAFVRIVFSVPGSVGADDEFSGHDSGLSLVIAIALDLQSGMVGCGGNADTMAQAVVATKLNRVSLAGFIKQHPSQVLRLAQVVAAQFLARLGAPRALCLRSGY